MYNFRSKFHSMRFALGKLFIVLGVGVFAAPFILGSFLFVTAPAAAEVSDLKLKNKVVDAKKKFVAGNFKYKGTDVTVVSYVPAGKTKPVTVLVFDTFSLADYVTDPIEKALLLDFEFKGAALIAVPEGSGVNNVKASALPVQMVEAMGGADSKLFPLNLKTGVNFAAGAGLKSDSITQTLINTMGVKKTSHVVKGTLSAKFFDLTCILSPSTPGCNLFSWKDLLALLKFDINLPNLKPNFWVPFEFANTKLDISRERDLLGKATGVIKGSLVSDIAMNTPGMGQTLFPAVRISGSLDTGISFRSWRGFNWPKLFNLPWVSLTEVKLDSKVKRDPLKLNAPPILEVKMTAKGRVNDVKNIPIESSFEIQGVNITGFYWWFPNFSFDLGKIPGLKDIPGIKGVRLTDPILSPTAIGGKLSIDKLGINKAPVLFFKTKKPKTGWNFATLRDNFSAATVIPPLKGTPIENIRLSKAALIISKPGFSGKVIDLPKKARAFLKGPLPDDDMALPLASGINIAGTFVPGEAGDIGKVLTALGAPKQLVLSGGVTGVFDKKKPSFRMSGNFLKLKMPDLGFFKIPQPKNAPALFMEYINNQPAIGVEVVETLPIKDGNRTIDFKSKLALTVGPGGANIAMTGTSIKDWPSPFGIKGLTLKTGTSLSVAGGVVGPQVSFKGITQIGDKQVTLGGTVAAAGAAIRGSIDSIGLTDVAILAAEIAKAGGGKLDISGLPAAEFKKVDIAFASPGISIPDLGIANGGTRMKGDFYFLSPKKALGRLDVNFDTTGMAIKTELGEIGIGPLVLKKNTLDLAAKTSAPPRFAIESESKILGVVTKVKLDAGAQRLDVASTQKFGSVFSFGFAASTGDTIDWEKFDITKADLRLATTLKSDPGKWIRESGSKIVRKAFDELKPGLNKAIKDLEKAQKDVDRLNGEITKMRNKVKKEKGKHTDRVKRAETQVKKLQSTINGLTRQMNTFKSRVKSCRQSTGICYKWKRRGGGCRKKKWGVCYSWHRVWWQCSKKRHVPNYPARAACEAKNTKPRAEYAWATTKRAGVISAKVTAYSTLITLRKGIENFPVDLDPRVAALIVAKEVARGTLEAAKQTVKGVGNFTDLLTAGVAAVGKADVFALENSTIRGSLNGGLKGKPVLLDMNFKLMGKPYKNRFGFSLTDWKYNAKQFEAIALGAATKAVIAVAKKSKIFPHVLIDRINELYLKRQAEVDANAEAAVKDNGGQFTTDPKDAKPLGRKIDLNNRVRRVKQESLRKKRIAFREKLRRISAKKRRQQLAALRAAGTTWNKMPGSALDVGAGANGSVWVVGTNGRPFTWTGKTWKQMPGGITRIDVGPKGRAWAVNKNREIFRWNGKKWDHLPGKAWDIGVGADGTAWVIGTNKEGGGFGIYRYNGFGWTKIGGSAVRIDVDPKGKAWVVNKGNTIYQWTGKNWKKMPGSALDVSIGADGTVMVIGTNRAPYQWDGKGWKKLSGANLENISVDKGGAPWGTTTKKVKNGIWAFGKARNAPAAKVEKFGPDRLRGKFLLKVKTSGKCLDKTGKNNRGIRHHQWGCNPKNGNQQFVVDNQKGEWFRIKNVLSKRCVDISGASKGNGGKVHQWDCHNGGNQKWKIVSRGGGWNSFVVQHSNKCLDLASGKKNNGAQFHQWDCNAKNTNQLFQVIGVQ